MIESKRKKLIIITVVLLIILVTVGVCMMVTKPESKKNNEKETTEKENNRCVDQLCISKISTDDDNGNNSITIILKNEGKTTINESCVKLVSKETNIELCVNDLEPEGEMVQVFEKKEMLGEKIEDFSLEKVEKKTTTE